MEGWAMEGWVTGAGRLGHRRAGPEGGARFSAGPGRSAASGTDAGGTGGGRSVNIWAETEAGIAKIIAAASASGDSSRSAPPESVDPHCPLMS